MESGIGRFLKLADTYKLSAENRPRTERIVKRLEEETGTLLSSDPDVRDMQIDAVAFALGVRDGDRLDSVEEKAILARLDRHQLATDWGGFMPKYDANERIMKLYSLVADRIHYLCYRAPTIQIPRSSP